MTVNPSVLNDKMLEIEKKKKKKRKTSSQYLFLSQKWLKTQSMAYRDTGKIVKMPFL